MDTTDSTRVLVAVEPFLLASALQRLLGDAGITAVAYDAHAPNEAPAGHICVAVIDDTAPHEVRRGTTVVLPPGSEIGEAVVMQGNGRVAVVFTKPAEILRIVRAALAACARCGSGGPLALVS